MGLLPIVLLLKTLSSASIESQLPDSLYRQIRAGAARLVLAEDSIRVPLVGGPTLPLVEAMINGHGPYRFLLDLGSNVVIVRRSVADSARATILLDRARTDIIRFDSMNVGGARFEGVLAGGYDTLDVDGVIGYNLLRLSSFTLDYPAQQLLLHRRSLISDTAGVVSYLVLDTLPYVMLYHGTDSMLVNLDTGATEWMTIPPALQHRIRWKDRPIPGPVLGNNQTGDVQVLEGFALDTLRIGEIRVPSPKIYINPDAENPWIGSSTMMRATWTFDHRNRRLEIRVPR